MGVVSRGRTAQAGLGSFSCQVTINTYRWSEHRERSELPTQTTLPPQSRWQLCDASQAHASPDADRGSAGCIGISRHECPFAHTEACRGWSRIGCNRTLASARLKTAWRCCAGEHRKWTSKPAKSEYCEKAGIDFMFDDSPGLSGILSRYRYNLSSCNQSRAQNLRS